MSGIPISVNYDDRSYPTGGIFSNPQYDDYIDYTDYGYDYGNTSNYYDSTPVNNDSSGYYNTSPKYDPVTNESSYYGGNVNTYLDSLPEDYYDNLQSTKIENTAKEGQTGYGWQYFSDGTAISPDGKYYYQGKLAYDPSGGSDVNTKALLGKLGDAAVDKLKSAFTKKNADGTESTDWRKVIGAAGAAAGATGLLGGLGGLSGSSGSSQPRGYQGGIPAYTAVRSAVPITGEQPKAGDPGRRYFSDQIYATADKVGQAQADTLNQAQGLAALQQIERKPLPSTAPTPTPSTIAANEAATDENKPIGLATGGIAGLNVKNGMYLGGPTDGMADKLPATIDGNQEAALSHGEFVIPADVVGHLGNGNSEAGAERLYAMMDKVRMARTGNPKQGKQINPNKFLPA
jgi:hypothetical protein